MYLPVRHEDRVLLNIEGEVINYNCLKPARLFLLFLITKGIKTIKSKPKRPRALPSVKNYFQSSVC